MLDTSSHHSNGQVKVSRDSMPLPAGSFAAEQGGESCESDVTDDDSVAMETSNTDAHAISSTTTSGPESLTPTDQRHHNNGPYFGSGGVKVEALCLVCGDRASG